MMFQLRQRERLSYLAAALKRMRGSKRESAEAPGRKVGDGKIEIFAFQWVGLKDREKSGCDSSASNAALTDKGPDAFERVLTSFTA